MLCVNSSVSVDCSGSSQVGLKWIKRIYNSKALSERRGSISFDELKLEYKTGQRYQTYRIFVPPAARPRLPLPGGYDRTGAIYVFVPMPGLEKYYFAMGRAEGHRSTSSSCFCYTLAYD